MLWSNVLQCHETENSILVVEFILRSVNYGSPSKIVPLAFYKTLTNPIYQPSLQNDTYVLEIKLCKLFPSAL